MTRQVLCGVSGVNPLGFLAALGLLRICEHRVPGVRLGFLDDGSFRAFVDGFSADLAPLVAEDASAQKNPPSWLFEYQKEEKKGTKNVQDLKPPPEDFKRFLHRTLDSWEAYLGDRARWGESEQEPVAYAASFATSVAVDGKKNTKPTAFHFTAANQQFLGAVLGIGASVTAEWAQESLFKGDARRSGSNLRWDPAADRNWALMAENPVDEGTSVDAPLEWLAFRGLPLLPSFPIGSRIVTTGVRGRGDDMKFSWPLWSMPATLSTARSLVQLDWAKIDDRAERGVFAVCTSAIRRTSQGFGNFGPAAIAP